MERECPEILSRIGSEAIRGGTPKNVVMPHDHNHVIGKASWVGKPEIVRAIDAAKRAKPAWEALPWQDRAAIFLRAADLLATSWRDTLNAATMLGQSKNAYQAEIDAACELIDFLRFNVEAYQEIQKSQPISPPMGGVWNATDHRPLEGFVLAITPFNFTAIAANLPAAPALVGNTVVWKPSDTQLLSAYHTMGLFKAAGLPDGVINLVVADGPTVGEVCLASPDLAGIHFTGSTGTFQHLWRQVGQNIAGYRTYPRLVGETGGKDFVFVHPSADLETAVTALVRGAYEYQGQKCSAASRAYLPKSMYPKLKERLLAEMATIKTGDVRDFGNFVNAVIDERAFHRITKGIEAASRDQKIVAGGKSDRTRGFFIDPTLIETSDPRSSTMVDELFGPVLTAFVYDDGKADGVDVALALCDATSPYALTGAILCQDRYALSQMVGTLRHAAGNLYLNDKPTGAVVGQQPFGGGRASGTNDKAGSALNLLRWISPRTIKENLNPPRNYRYPFLGL